MASVTHLEKAGKINDLSKSWEKFQAAFIGWDSVLPHV